MGNIPQLDEALINIILHVAGTVKRYRNSYYMDT